MPLEIKNFADQINTLRHENKLHFDLIVDKIAHLYRQLMRIKVTENNRIHIEKLKTQLIELFYLKLNIESEVTQSYEKQIPWHKKAFGYCFSLIGTFLAGIAGYTAAGSMIAEFTNFSNPLSLVTSLAIGAVEALIFIGLDVLDVKKTGSKFIHIEPCMKEYEIQLEKTRHLQKLLLSNRAFRRLSSKDYIASKSFLSALQDDVRYKNEEISNIYKDSPTKKLIKTFFSITGAVLCTGSGIIAGKGLLGLFGAAALASTPIGWVVGISAGIFSLATFIYNKRNSLMKMFDKFIGFPKKLKKSQEKFLSSAQKYHQFLNEIIADKKYDESKEKAMNDRVMALENQIDELKLLINMRSELSQASMPIIKPLLVNNKKRNAGKIFSDISQIKNIFFQSERKTESSNISVVQSPSLIR